jgi:L,D-transpeptidase catalytic domain
MVKRIHITFNKLGEGQMDCKEFKTFRCLGKKGLKYPTDLMIDPARPNVKTNPYFSQEYVCDYAGVVLPCKMNFSILIWGQRGIFIHEWPNPATYIGNGGPTGGCIHLDIGNAKQVYDWVNQKTRITMDYPW